MNCQERDANLLLLGLGELGAGKRLQTAFHLKRCPRCQARQAQLLNASGLMARTIRTGSPVSSSPLPTVPPLSPMLTWLLLLVIGAGILAVGSALYVHFSASPLPIIKDEGCRPGLPNDLCR
jgi:hypothetical protein